MDITEINRLETNTDVGVIIGDTNAPKAIIEFVNLRCPYCREWFKKSKEIIDQAVKDKKAYRVIKLFDKEKESLQRGNVMHRYVTKGDTKKAFADITRIYETQDQWGNLELEEVAKFAEQQLSLENYEDSLTTEAIIDEAERANIRFVPTIIIEDKIFDESVDLEDLKHYIESES